MLKKENEQCRDNCWWKIMRIGIITWFTGPNYGTNLQAIAIKYVTAARIDWRQNT